MDQVDTATFSIRYLVPLNTHAQVECLSNDEEPGGNKPHVNSWSSKGAVVGYLSEDAPLLLIQTGRPPVQEERTADLSQFL